MVILLVITTSIKFPAQNQNIINLQFLFNITFFLFLSGRLITYIYFKDFNPFELNFMRDYVPSKKKEIVMLLYLATFIIVTNIGYHLFKFEPNKIEKNFGEKEVAKYFIFSLAIFFFAISLMENIELLKRVLSLGYLSRYESQALKAEVGEGTTKMLFYSFTALALALCKSKKTAAVFLMVFIAYGIVSILGGERGPFITLIFMIFWYLFRNKKQSFIPFLLFTLVAFLS